MYVIQTIMIHIVHNGRQAETKIQIGHKVKFVSPKNIYSNSKISIMCFVRLLYVG